MNSGWDTVAVYLAGALVFGTAEGWLLKTLNFQGSWGLSLYAIFNHLLTAIVAPIGAIAAAAAGFFGVFSEINNTEGITSQAAFQAWAMPIFWFCFGVLLFFRIVPFLLMNLRRPVRAFLYSTVVCVGMACLYVLIGLTVAASVK